MVSSRADGRVAIVEAGEPTTLTMREILGPNPGATTELEADRAAIDATEDAAHQQTLHTHIGQTALVL